MTELEIMQRAKMYIDMLAKGQNPLTGMPVAETDVVNQVRISKCLRYVCDVLGKVIDNGGTVGAPGPKPPFVLRPERLGLVEFSEYPIGISDLCKRISAAAADPNWGPLRTAPVLTWLEERGFLMKSQAEEGKKGRVPTPQGNQLGITLSDRTGYNGSYTAVVYNINAQRFIAEHLPEMLSREE